jgi:two-component system, LuxR family, response regulator FixJ
MRSADTVFIVDDDEAVRESLRLLLETSGYRITTFPSGKLFLEQLPPTARGCVIIDVRMPEIGGLEVQQELKRRGINLPLIVMTGHGDVPLAVRAMKAGATDFIEKPFKDDVMCTAIERALQLDHESRNERANAAKIHDRAERLTAREREVLELLVGGHPNKVIAHRMAISPRTVEIHRSRVMEKMQARTLSELVRMTLESGILLRPTA